MRKILSLAISLFALGIASPAEAAEIYSSNTIMLISLSSQSDVHVVQFPTNIAAPCNISTVSRAYIDKEDKQLYAAALSAATKGATVSVGIETAATAKTIPSFLPSPLTCKVISIFIS